MKKFLTSDYIANQIRMLRKSKGHTSVLIAEGDTDVRVWQNLIDPKNCHIENAFNKDQAIKILEILTQDNCLGIVAIIDADFDILEEKWIDNLHLFCPDGHDLETMLLKSPALEKLLREYASVEKLSRFGQDVRTTLLNIGKVLGYLRWASLKFNWSLKFEGLNFSKFIDDKTLTLNMDKLITTIKNHSQKPGLDSQEIKNQIEALKKLNHDAWNICCGHDLVEILSIGLCKVWGSNDTKDVAVTKLEKDLRLAYERSFFYSTQLYIKILSWQKAHQPFIIVIETTIDST